ncbi:helix-turn-helix transcriptional regulator [Gemmobacter sp.]|uniref:helix-turn-helix domain-containing protein n=1 Tax=Gemmobacter sp. TaxID=1898957 RepID=UPI002AFEEFE2|nr:helix-turn-helix transcriptional regulator [Gemmobacter sp.]
MPKTLWSDAQQALVAALVKARKEAGLSQAALAGRLRCQQSLIARIESGERRIDVVEFVILTRSTGADASEMLERLATLIPGDAAL